MESFFIDTFSCIAESANCASFQVDAFVAHEINTKTLIAVIVVRK